VFHALDALGVFGVIVILVGQHFLQLTRSVGNVNSHLEEEVKVLLFFG
jgi:hypothetical protein